MNTHEFLDYLKHSQINLSLQNGQLKCRAPKGLLTSTLRTEIAARKVEIFQCLEALAVASPPSIQRRDLVETSIANTSSSPETNPADITLKPDNFPLVVTAPAPNVNLCDWIVEHRSAMRTKILTQGAILFRNFKLDGVIDFERFIQRISGPTIPYSGESAGVTPRTTLHNHIYTSTEFSPRYHLPLHNECSFAYTWPLKIFFYCLEASSQGGATPIADSRNVLQRLPDSIKQGFIDRGVMYTRNYGLASGPTWQKVFNTTDKAVVEDCCRQAGTSVTWYPGDRLLTQTQRSAILQHPKTGESVWFNHIYQTNIASLDPNLNHALREAFKPEELPRNSYYGDGSEIEASVLEAIKTAYQQETVRFDWQSGDVLMLDNMLTAHGREPFMPPRQVVVGMSEPFNRDLTSPVI
ncbi:TauD/TfdA family dioxygenase [filamentous cyanobacterium LEGE 11480]|uniref:TauD/TfdA family dioxygenase n=1 Tax=Romeriopsis navalis LEGE 11480 TaxID=2777977 RepID=A0A928Z3C8_9CYAN|nr:TauD/TfdA family dioxygenase [Romeriopsis navalis]MBE9029058.1 TauD/TfdA family dioxygenase [Romeriopsis navalis LEGE 11480]